MAGLETLFFVCLACDRNNAARRICRILHPDQFLRVHRSALVALKQVKEIRSLGSGRLKLMLSDGSEQDVSRSYSQETR